MLEKLALIEAFNLEIQLFVSYSASLQITCIIHFTNRCNDYFVGQGRLMYC